MSTFINNLARARDQAHDAARKLMREIAEDIRDEASANAPVKSGELRGSYHVSQVDDLTFRVGSTAAHAPHVEYGSTRTPARPHLLPAAENARRKLKG